jgi:hypothetical protein
MFLTGGFVRRTVDYEFFFVKEAYVLLTSSEEGDKKDIIMEGQTALVWISKSVPLMVTIFAWDFLVN